MTVRRTEELQEWICSVTATANDHGEHLSVMLRDGQLLCLLANGVDPSASLKVNKLNTVFHSKANIRLFLEWCKKQGLNEGEIFQPDDLLDAGADFGAVLETLSILFDRFGTIGYTGEYEEDPVSDAESLTSTGSSQGASPVKKANSNSKLSSFMKGGFLSRKKKQSSKKLAVEKSPEGTPPSTPPPVSPQVGGSFVSPPRSPPMSPQQPPPQRSDSGGASANRLNAFLNQVPASHHSPLTHVERPSGPPKKNSVRKPPPPKAKPAPTVRRPPSPKQPPKSQPTSSGDTRNKFAAFMKSNPPAVETTPAAVGSGGSSNLSAFKASVSPTAGTTKPVMAAPSPPKSAPARARGTSSEQFAQRKAVFAQGGSNSPKPAPVPPKPVVDTGSANKLNSFMKQQPSSSPAALKPRSQSKLAAFLATTNTVPSIATTSSAVPAKPTLVSFNPLKNAPAGGRSGPTPAYSAPTPAAHSAPRPFKQRHMIERSTGRGNYIRKRQTYWVPPKRRRSNFSLENKRKAFMNEQLEIKEEQLRQQAAGAGNKQNLIVPGVQCYIPDKEEVWLLAEIVDFNERRKEVTLTVFLDDGDSEQRVLNLKDPEVIRAIGGPTATEVESLPIAILHDNPEGVEDMRLLRYLNEPSILFNLKQRFAASKPYTYTNDIVIAVNPYKWIENLYGDHLHEQYLRKPRDSLSPHVYSTSTAAYKHMTTNEMNQSILVSGESGAGKTETTKIVMNHLASVAGGRKDKTIAKVIDVNPLLESFGNAKTTRNDNSSRFGKFTQLQFDDRGKLIGAKCETYLLEKSRVVSIAEGERNYHIFYQLLAGLPSKTRKEFGLDPECKYQYAGALAEMQIPGLDDSKWFAGTQKSLTTIGLDANAQRTLFKILSGVLLLGEVIFDKSGENGSRISSGSALSQVAKMFGLPTTRIEEALCNRTVITRNDSVTVPLAPIEAAENRDALAKTIYSKMFDWMVVKINAAISTEESRIKGQIGVLDIFGFEDFVHNGFEQFCINYANEKLQQKFTTDVFKTVEDEYIREGLQWDHIQYQDNQGIVEVIEGKLGIIALMNDHLRQPRDTEEALVNKIRTNHQTKKDGKVNESIDFPKVKRTQFIVNHYAGSVTYETVGFMEKHRDTLQKDLLDLIQLSSLSLLPELFVDSEVVTEGGSGRGKKAPKSLGSQFKTSLAQLMDNIRTTNTHYVRCIKPNSNKSPTEFNKRMIVEQLRSAGVIEAIRITRSGYPSRLTPKELATRYAIMFPPSMHSKDVRRTCSVFMSSIGRKSPLEYQMGKTLIYFKNGVMEELEAMKSDFMYYEARTVQRIALGFIERRRLRNKIRAAIVLQSYARMSLDMKEYHFQRRAIIRIQRGWRRYKAVPVEPEYNDSVAEYNNDGGQWVDDFDDLDDSDGDEGFGDDPASIRAGRGRSVADRMESFKVAHSGRRGSVKRLNELSARAKSFMKPRSGSGSTSSSSGISLEDENSMLKIENRNLKYDLELMREQCIELQAIILEINKSRKR
ncbi:Myosin-10 [Phytophthora fragariae]|uniref:Myosin-10 n=1 Tax=Phytophthora fragariae TaxID=53985 RepID=A0A6A3EGW6_9STRA|nr:Myosin-10 [Phytophthora fragariae]KAE8931517.1 Myosin-10 [Phytophthora fragariae]KAE9095148.1 Myosin-10 [Phytophthora fragariae]KAE9127776.1 Myosin-10 [Phytophthora fragariae]KAE9194133.1 Myosin-10 [Phytophthora fragariae]